MDLAIAWQFWRQQVQIIDEQQRLLMLKTLECYYNISVLLPPPMARLLIPPFLHTVMKVADNSTLVANATAHVQSTTMDGALSHAQSTTMACLATRATATNRSIVNGSDSSLSATTANERTESTATDDILARTAETADRQQANALAETPRISHRRRTPRKQNTTDDDVHPSPSPRKPEKPPKERVHAACSFCHTNRIKCNRQRPCHPCQHRGIVCEYRSHHKRGRPKAEHGDDEDGSVTRKRMRRTNDHDAHVPEQQHPPLVSLSTESRSHQQQHQQQSIESIAVDSRTHSNASDANATSLAQTLSERMMSHPSFATNVSIQPLSMNAIPSPMLNATVDGDDLSPDSDWSTASVESSDSRLHQSKVGPLAYHPVEAAQQGWLQSALE